MLQYRAATFLIRTVAPEISMGLQSTEELEDSHEVKHAQGFVAQAATLKSEATAITEHAQTIDVPAPAVEAQPAQEPAAVQQTPQAKRGPAWAAK